ncbi:MAG: VWA domain-containing protein [Planctomycetota bacterium]
MRERARGPSGADLMKLGAALLGVAALAAWFPSAPSRGADAQGNGAAGRPAVTAILVDRSASVTRTRPLWRRWVVGRVGAAVQGAAQRGDEVALVLYARDATRAAGPSTPEAFIDELHGRSGEWFGAVGAGGDLGTDLAAAADVAGALVSEEGRAPGTIVVLGAGDYTGLEPSEALLRSELRALVHVPPPPPSRVELGVERVRVPEEVAPGAQVPVELDLVVEGPSLSGGRRVVVDWEIELTGTDSSTRGRRMTTSPDGDLAGGLRLQGSAVAEVPLSARGGGASHQDSAAARPRRFSVQVLLPGAQAGSARLRVVTSLEGTRSDPIPENNVGTSRWRIGDPVRVAVVAPAELLRDSTALFTGPALDGIEFRGLRIDRLASTLDAEPA